MATYHIYYKISFTVDSFINTESGVMEGYSVFTTNNIGKYLEDHIEKWRDETIKKLKEERKEEAEMGFVGLTVGNLVIKSLTKL